MPAGEKRTRAANLKPRAKPVQGRSRESSRKILEATHRLLKREGPSGVTTPAIAREADVSVGAVYHFFPNKEAIILALYEERLEGIRAIAIAPVVAKKGDWRSGMRQWLRDVKRQEAEIDFDLSMNEAMEHFPHLKEVSRAHAKMLAEILVEKMKSLGSPWPDDALFDLALHTFFLNQSLWLYWSFAGASLPQGLERLADGIVALMAPAIE
ncbi:MAG TPA: TetR/AcrR family transcriptional regulator, partial [Verrucomicrobiae bacterium]|nr:TetR/AcrR family transcriptional regulator [Verrucomicrobiae bacterium]